MKLVAVMFANPKGNVGDFAILDAMLRDIEARFPEHCIDVYWHGFLEEDRERLAAFKAEATPEFNIAGGTFYHPVKPELKRLYRLKLWPWVQPRLITNLVEVSKVKGKVFAKYDAVFLAGGDQWNGMDLGVSMFGTLLSIAKYNQNIHHYPFSLNPAVRNFNTDADLRRYFSLVCQPLIVRDGISQDVMDQIGIPAVLGQDVVFKLSDVGQEISPKTDRDPNRVLLVLTGPHDRALLANNLMETLERLKKGGRAVEMLTTCPPEDLQIYEELGAKFDVAVRAPMTWQEAVAELKQSAIVVTDRLHCLILGTFAECTLFPVADRKKAEAFIHDSGVPHYSVDMKGVTAQALDIAITDREVILEKMRNYRDSAVKRDTAPRLMKDT